MKVVIIVELMAAPTNSGEIETYVELQKRIDLPFAPYVGLNIHLPAISELEPTEPIAVTGIVNIEKVTYNAELDSFLVFSRDAYAVKEERDAAAKQLEVNYGFETIEL